MAFIVKKYLEKPLELTPCVMVSFNLDDPAVQVDEVPVYRRKGPKWTLCQGVGPDKLDVPNPAKANN